ncbi:carbon starvation protein CstA [Desulfotomaculum nigrificans CO-1-SRB]|uniref:Carbon starvation protein CstA n=1 Tax=Desulfotomaculum nigrificans (strain DSM 14880 / VKM B-2319 / CO-1-SRB) TaxID=868595 RepID=F6B2L5_DESCC|nr:carbon starvation protein A [Desulfotomaculum nigrificans]AEF93844.1 carbon starvation protein CstA [Desulfotomaculum nigrificans CO-1-SRB]
MNGLTLVIGAALFLILAYRFYGAFMAAKVLTLDASRVTPAIRLEDGRDYVPTNKWIVFGHHFAAIAGAGPLIGPVLAAQFGYLPGTLWILIGAVLAGAVHDMVVLFASVRYDGMSLAEIAKKELGTLSGFLTSIAILFILIITMAGLALAVVNALFGSPWGTFTVGVTIPIALFIGVYLRWLRPGKIGEATVIGVTLVLLGVIAGPYIQHSALAPYLTFTKEQLAVILAVYGFTAAALPVWLLLAPRDYLSTYMKIGVILALAVGIIIVNPTMQMPAVTKFVNGGGPIIPGKVWPFMFITIACGAMSGFHALISTGTTPKMITNERDIKIVGFGGMLTEAFVALMALIAAAGLFPGDYFAINTAPEVFQKLGMQVKDIAILSQMVGENVAGRPGGAVSLAVGMAHIFSSVPGLKHLMSYWYHFIIMFEALFILTTIDAGTRVGRYILQEMGGAVYKPLKNHNWWPGIIACSVLISLAWGYLVYGGNISTIWPLFGVANQLLGTMALAIGTTMIIRNGKARYAWTTVVPMTFLAVTTLAAGYLNIFTNYLPKGNTLLATLSAIMMVLVVVVIVDSVRNWIKLLAAQNSGNDRVKAAQV